MNTTPIAIVAFVALGGALGAVLRFGITGIANTGPFPWGTFVVNVVGCFAAGFLVAVALHPGETTVGTRAFVLTGVLGGFTTLSTFSLETIQLLAGGRWVAGLANLALNGVVCVGATGLGFAVGALVAE
ncbi:MAG: fluoride efflux transporter FluC [Thermoplasmata archaeon]